MLLGTVIPPHTSMPKRCGRRQLRVISGVLDRRDGFLREQISQKQ